LPADILPDGRGGLSGRVVPDYFGTAWAAAIGSRDVGMKAERVTNAGEHRNHGGGVFLSWRKTGEKGLASLCSVRKITKRAHAGRWPETKWEILTKKL
jgi:hypothetical protein